MKKSLFFVALGAMALTSCSQDEVKHVNQDAVTFSVVADNASRGTMITTETIKEFNVTAYLQEEFTSPSGAYTANGKVFMDAMNVTKDENGNWSPNVTKFWPTEGAINFYSYAPLTIASGVNFAVDKQTIAYEVPTTCADQQDVLYAFNSGLTKADKNVPVNFRHALSQIQFQAKNTKADLEVEIVDVRVVNVKNSGVLTMPKIQTSSFLYNADPMVNRDTETDDTWGKWNLDAAVLKSYPADMLNETTTLTGVVAKTLSKTTSPLLLMPQVLSPATIADNYMTFDGAFFAIKCKIYSIEDGSKTLLWPKSDGYAEVAIPVTSPDKNAEGKPMWKQGKKYVYTFVFGEGAGYIGPDGIEPDPSDPGVDPVDPNGPNTVDPNEPGDPVLVPVTFTVTVDMFQTAKEAVDMNTGN